MQTCISLLFLFYTFTLFQVKGQGIYFPGSAGSLAYSLGGASSNLSNAFSAHNNPSTIAFNPGVSFGFGVTSHYLIPGLLSQHLGLTYFNSKKFGLGLGVERFGDQWLNQSKADLSIVHKISKTALSLTNSVYQEYVEGYGYRHFFGLQLSSATQLNDKLTTAIIIRDPVVYNSENNSFSYKNILVTSGFTYFALEQFSIRVDIRKSSKYFSSSLGILYSYKGALELSIGILTDPMVHFIGIGYKKGKLKLNVSGSIHPTLGFSSSGSVEYRFLKKSTNSRTDG